MKTNGQSYLPTFSTKGECGLRLRCLPPGSLVHRVADVQTQMAEDADDSFDEKFWSEAVAIDQSPPSPVEQSPPSPVLPKNSQGKSDVPALISLGPLTDIITDTFQLDDTLLPQLHTLVTTVRSSKWSAALRRSPWFLTEEQSSALASAMIADTRRDPSAQIKVRCTYLYACLRENE